jgi:hypothetical protein
MNDDERPAVAGDVIDLELLICALPARARSRRAAQPLANVLGPAHA